MDKYHELNSIHNVSEQKHQRELASLHQQVQEQSQTAANTSVEDSLNQDSSQRKSAYLSKID